MKKEEVPQDEGSFYAGHRRACYAVDSQGRYVLATSAGWEVETLATAQALEALEERVEAARVAVQRGEASPLLYHMERRQYTPKILAQCAGMAAWRVRRHLRPRPYAGLARRLKARYAEALAVPVDDLDRVPEAPVRVFMERRLAR